MGTLLSTFLPDKNHLISEEMCNNCSESENIVELKTCERCLMIQYCSPECQKEHFYLHKKDCQKFKELTDNVKQLAEELRNFIGYNQPAENYFETQVGLFWGLEETRDYCRARLELANEIYKAWML
jgi:hypothetical protein